MNRTVLGTVLLGTVLLGTVTVNPPALAAELPEAPRFEVSRAASAIRIDGKLDEAAWAEAVVIELLWEWLPGDNVPPPVGTECLVTYDDERFYVAFRAADPDPSAIRAHLMDRDDVDSFIQDDHVLFLIDTFNDERRAFHFRVNPMGVQMDAINDQVADSEDFSWDAIWDAAGRITADGYQVEIAVPFNQLRFPRGDQVQTWGFSAERSYPRSNRHRITSHPRRRDEACGLCQYNKLTGFSGLRPGRDLEIDPTVTAVRTDRIDDFPDGRLVKGDEDVEGGVTAGWGITPSLMLNAAVNPDFSHVEADVAQLEVNTRFALFYPEKRPFFLEGAHFFSTPLEAVFTRTIVDPIWGVKLTGQEGRNGLGVLFAEDEDAYLLIPGRDYSSIAALDGDVRTGVLRYRRDVGAASSLGGLYAGRSGDRYSNHVYGADGFFRLSDTNQMTFQVLRSATEYPWTDDRLTDEAYWLVFSHIGRNWVGNVLYRDVRADFRTDAGFRPRVDVRTTYGNLTRRIWGEAGDWYNRIDLAARASRDEDHDGQLLGRSWQLAVHYDGPLQSNVGFGYTGQDEFFDGMIFDADAAWAYLGFKPTGAVQFRVDFRTGDAVDFAGARQGRQRTLSAQAELRPGRHLNLRLEHTRQVLAVTGDELYEVNLSQLRAVYQFNVRTFVRAMVQYTDLERNPAVYPFAVGEHEEDLFAQLLFSYKLNPQTVLFAGYTDSQLGFDDVGLTRTGRTFFLKVGYALLF